MRARGVVAIVMVVEIMSVDLVGSLASDATTGSPPMPVDYSNTKALGAMLYTKYVYPFEIAAVILLVAIVAAIVLTMRRRTGQKVQDISRQVAVRRDDRVRIVKVECREATDDHADARPDAVRVLFAL